MPNDLESSKGPASVQTAVLIPALNEAERLPALLDAVRELDESLRLVVIDDGSHDETEEVAKAHGATVLRHPFNLGYGAALQTGYKFALEEGIERVVQMDADGQHVPEDIPKLLGPIRAGEADLVIGSRFLEETGYAMGWTRNIGRNLFRRFARLVGGLDVTDPTSGFQAMNRSVLELYSQEFFPSDYPDVDVLLVVHRAGLRVRECSVVMKAGVRPSTLHGGFRSIYYLYRLVLAVWAGFSRRGNRFDKR